MTQDTGFSEWMPVGEGLMAFRDPEEAAAALNEVERDYHRHSGWARALAENYFDSDRVLARLIDKAIAQAQP
ncbi:MAG: hypothetical protein H0T48_03230 [Gemmatimonadaceae bacterium]|nr:hypothetical protein [Gemmatimonadaceae bacterium]